MDASGICLFLTASVSWMEQMKLITLKTMIKEKTLLQPCKDSITFHRNKPIVVTCYGLYLILVAEVWSYGFLLA